MPCNSEYLAPNDREKESIKVRKLIRALHKNLGMPVLERFSENQENGIYGNEKTLDKDTDYLCRLMRETEPTIKYRIASGINNGDDIDLLAWWGKHQKWDNNRDLVKKLESRLKMIRKKLAEVESSVEEVEIILLEHYGRPL